MKKTFVLNDETKVNSYGFRVRNAGIDLERFKQNPVMLDMHFESNSYVIGKWEDIRIEGNLLLADAVFDVQDERANNIAGKVERGFIKGCSMGLAYNGAPIIMLENNVYELPSCELIEVSIVAVPSNANAVKLFNQKGELLKTEEVKLTLSLLSNESLIQNENTMKKIALSMGALLALGYTAQPNDSEAEVLALSNNIEKMKKDLDAATQAKTDLQAKIDKLNLENEAEATKLVADALLAGKFTALEKEEYEAMAKQNLSFAKKVIGQLPAKTSLGLQVDNPPPGASVVKTHEDFQKLSHAQQLAFKNEQPEAYKQLFG